MLSRDLHRRAYLIARLVPTEHGGYECHGFGIYSERDPTDLVGVIHAVVAASDKPTFHEAHAELVEFARDWYPPLGRQAGVW